MAISGALVAAPKNAPIPTKVYITGLTSRPGTNICTTLANNAPKAAPTNKAGVNTPPIAPEPTVLTVAKTLANSIDTMAYQAQSLCNKDHKTLKPLPARAGV